MIKKNTGLWLAFYFLLAFALSAWLLQFNYFMTPDGIYYARMGQNIVSGGGVGVNSGEPFVDINPFYPFLIGLVDLLIKDLELAGHIVSMLAFSLTVVPLFLLVREMYSDRAAHWATLFYLTSDFILYYSNQILTESLFTFLIITLLFVVHRYLQNSRRSVFQGISLGLVGGAAFLTRSEAFLFFLFGLAALLLGGEGSQASRIKQALTGGLVFLLIALPYVGFIHQTIGHWTLSGHAPNILIHRELDLNHPGQWMEAKKIYEGLSRDRTRMKIDELVAEFDSLAFLRRNFSRLLQSGLGSLKWRLLELTEILFKGAAFFLIGASLFAVSWTRNRKKSELLLFLFLLPLLPYFFLFFDPRHYHPFLVIFSIWMGEGAEQMRIWARGTFGWGPKKTILLALAVCLFFTGISASRLHRTFRNLSLPSPHKTMGLWMRENIPDIAREKVASRIAYVNFYSGAGILRLPYVERFEDFLTFMEHQNARYFLIGEDLGEPLINSYRFLLEGAEPLPLGLSQKYVLPGPFRMILYEIKR